MYCNIIEYVVDMKLGTEIAESVYIGTGKWNSNKDIITLFDV